MDASPAKRRIAFALIVFVLVALGAYLLRPASHGSGHTGGRPVAGGSATPGKASPAPGSASSPAGPGQSQPPAGQADIYQWLPFTQQDLTAAAAVVLKFGAAYGTFSYTENAADYVRPLQSVTSPALAGQLAAAYSTPGVASVRSGTRQVSAGSAAIESIRAFGAGSLTFVVQITERLTDVSGRSQHSTSYAVTLTGNGASWLVSAIELATTGNS